MNLRDIAHALRGEVSGSQVLAPGPGHSQADRSLAVRLSTSSPDRLLIFSHSGDEWRLCRKHVRERLGLASCPPGATAHVIAPTLPNIPTRGIEDNARARRALAI
jgi:putative DNA primase/helicase